MPEQEKKCGAGEMRVDVRATTTKAGVRRKAYSYCREDVGKPGKSPKTVPTSRISLTAKAVGYGILEPGERFGSMSDSDMAAFSLKLAEDLGPKEAYRELKNRWVLHYRGGPFKEKLEVGLKAITEKYPRG